MTRYALLCGSAPEGMIQKKIDSMHDFLVSEQGGAWQEREIMIFPNGIDEATLVYVLNNLRVDGTNHILLYICTETPVGDSEQTVWLGGNEVRKSIFEQPAALSGFALGAKRRTAGRSTLVEGGSAMIESEIPMSEPVGATPATTKHRFSVQTVYDSDREFVSGEEYFFDEASAPEFLAAGAR